MDRPGEYVCHCPLVMELGGDDYTCEHIDECADDNGWL